MDCHEIQERILASLEHAPATRTPATWTQEIEAHLSGCEACARFARAQEALDASLTTMLAPPALSPRFRPVLRERIRHAPAPARPDVRLDVVHFASCGVATLALAMLLPFSPALVIGVGTTFTLTSYVLLSAVRSSFDEQPLGTGA